MTIEITNQQRIKRIHLKKLKGQLEKVFKILNISPKKASFLLCDNLFIKKINSKYFKVNTPTDIIAFPLKDSTDPDYLGEVIVSVEQAALECDKYGSTYKDELFLYLTHGILHLLGYDDKTKREKETMQEKEKEILEKVRKS